jgi:hypothetical protein
VAACVRNPRCRSARAAAAAARRAGVAAVHGRQPLPRGAAQREAAGGASASTPRPGPRAPPAPGDLDALLKRRKFEGRPLSDDEAFGLFVQAVLALEHVHRHNLIHRRARGGGRMGGRAAGAGGSGVRHAGVVLYCGCVRQHRVLLYSRFKGESALRRPPAFPPRCTTPPPALPPSRPPTLSNHPSPPKRPQARKWSQMERAGWGGPDGGRLGPGGGQGAVMVVGAAPMQGQAGSAARAGQTWGGRAAESGSGLAPAPPLPLT